MEKSKVTHPTLEHRRAVRALAFSREAIRRAWIDGLSFALVLVAWSFVAQARSAPDSFADLAERLLPTVVIAGAMIINLVVAAGAGFSIPLILKRLDIDPAIAGGVVLTTVTDVVGYMAFLGLGALYLL